MIPSLSPITVRPLVLHECDDCGHIFSEPVTVDEWEPCESPGFQRGSLRKYQVSPCCFETFHECGDE